MKRLGYLTHTGEGVCNPKLAGYTCRGECTKRIDGDICPYWRAAFKKLSEYEDSGLEPKEVIDLANKI